MAFFEAVRLALQTIRAQKLKSAFSIVGVFIGVMFLIAVVSVVQGMNRYMTDKFAGTILGVNTFRLRQFPDVQLGNVTDSTWRVWRRRPRVTYEDARRAHGGPPAGQGGGGHGGDGALLRDSVARARAGSRLHRPGGPGRRPGSRARPRAG